MNIIVARTADHYLAAIQLFKEYATGLGIDLQFQKFDLELETLPSMYGPPVGELWLVQEGEQFIGCAGLRQLMPEICELKRMFIQPSYRGLHLGEQLIEVALSTAKTLGYQKMKLDALRRLTPALQLYQRYGFKEIPPYNYNPEADVMYFERNLHS